MSNCYKTSHYIFYYPDGYIAQHIQEIADYQEQCYQEIEEFFCTCSDIIITYHLFNTPLEVGACYGDNEPCNGFVRYENNEVYAVYNQEVQCLGPHEDAHLICRALLGYNERVFVREGLAEFFAKTWRGMINGQSVSLEHSEWVKHLMATGQYIPLPSIYDNADFYQVDCHLTYPIAGAFTTYLMDNYGFDYYLKFYQNSSGEAFQQVYGKSLAQLEKEFIYSYYGKMEL